MDTVKSFKNCPNKRYTQQCIFNAVAGLKCTATVLLGPNCEDYIRKLFSKICTTKDCKIISYEYDWNNFCKQREIINKLPKRFQNRIETNFGSIINAKPTLFMDIDLCCSIVNGSKIVETLFKRQEQEFKTTNKSKVFAFSFSSHGQSPVKTISFVEQLLGISFHNHFISNNPHGKEYTFISTSDKYHVRFFIYSDTSGMQSVLIQY